MSVLQPTERETEIIEAAALVLWASVWADWMEETHVVSRVEG